MIEPILGPTIPSFQQTSHTHYLPHTRVIGDHMVRSEEPSSGFFSSIISMVTSFFKWLFCCGCCEKEFRFDDHLTTFKEMAGKVSIMDPRHPQPIYEEGVFSQFLDSAKHLLEGKPEDLSESDYLSGMESFFKIFESTYIPSHKTLDQTSEKLEALLNEHILLLNDRKPIDNPTNSLKIQAARDVISYIEFSLTYVEYLKLKAEDDLKEKIGLLLKLYDWPETHNQNEALVSSCLKTQLICPVLEPFACAKIDIEVGHMDFEDEEILTIDFLREFYRLFQRQPQVLKDQLTNVFNHGDAGSVTVRQALRKAIKERMPRDVSYITVRIPVPKSREE